MAGRPPKPTVLKVLAGNPGKRPLNDREPKPLVGAEPPAYVKGDVRLMTEWGREAARLTRIGVLTEVDGEALGRLCVLRLRFADAVVEEARPGTLAAISKEMRALEAQFGIGAANRSRVKIDKPDPKSKLERFLGKA